ncbi:FAD-dependent oxidoreductase [Aquibium sp. LZ166]|uniref:FAD-dependent oxidoreductase n=1 Tax=Aquibium pacificus TaxID=3153579 RepID=A0ABV3SMP9_9HYPH
MAELEVDVVVVGSGIAGLSAALAAQAHGFSTILVEKSTAVGGGTSHSYGLIWVGGNHIAEREGISDDMADVRRYLDFLSGGHAETDRLEAFIRETPSAIRFFEDCGIPFLRIHGLTDHYFDRGPGSAETGRSIEAAPMSGYELGPWRQKLYTPPGVPFNISAEELVGWGGIHSFSSWDRDTMENRKKEDFLGLGVGLVARFLKALIDRDVPVWTDAALAELVVEDGRTKGIVLTDGRMIGARRGVVLATGGYESNLELARNYDGLPGYRSIFPENISGDGMICGAEKGAAIRQIHQNLQLMLGFSMTATDTGKQTFRPAAIIELTSPHTIVVNRAGRRFANEAYFQAVGPKLREFDPDTHQYVNLPCYLIFDSQYAQKFSFAGLPAGSAVPEWVERSDTMEGLADKLGMDPASLTATVGLFNAFCDQGRDADFDRGANKWKLAAGTDPTVNSSLGRLDTGPFYGIELHPSVGASAGLATDVHGQVLHVRGHPMPGLYASGNAAAHTEFGTGYQAGLTLASCMTFSLQAVRHMKAAAQ